MQASFVAILLLLLGLGYGSYQNVKQIIEDSGTVRHTVEVLMTIQTAYGDAVGAQSLERGFLLQPDADFGERYDQLRFDAHQQVVQLEYLVQDNPRQLERAKLFDGKIAAIYRDTTFLSAKSHEQMLEGVRKTGVGTGEQLMADIVNVRDAMINDENLLLQIRTRRRDENVAQAGATFTLAAVLTLGLLIGFYWLFSHHMGTLARAHKSAEENRSELQRRVAEKERAERELQRSNRELQEFAFVASHDLQEPLRKIRAFADRLRTRSESGLDETSLDYLARMDSAATRMSELIEALLNLSRVTTKGQPFARVDLNEALAVVLDDIQERFNECHAQITITDLPTIDGDPIQIRQLFQNLISNSIKFKAPGRNPRIEISLVPIPDPTSVSIRLRDNGIGFDPRHADRIFAVFQRLHGRGEYEGSGIGLAICRRIVNRHGGNITATSAPREGATFTIVLPKRQLDIST